MEVRNKPYEMAHEEIQAVENEIKRSSSSIDKLLDTFSISALKISNLPDIFKNYLNYKASVGESDPSSKEFLEWLKDPTRSKLTPSKIQNVLDHIAKNKAGFVAAFKIANMLIELKYKLKEQLDAHASQNASVVASIGEHPGHEGFVADTPHGKIKLVNRPVFMKKV
jgi:chaperonin GroEL (HSP60 family)